MDENRKINILQVTEWLASATSSNKGFLLKPNDLRMLYMYVLWNFISKNHIENKPLNINNDSQIEICEKDLIRMVKILFNDKYYSYFNKVYNM